MDKVFPQFGGYPRRWDDLVFMQNAYLEALHAATIYLDNTFLSGGVLSNGNQEISSGFVKINGELFFLIGGVIDSQGTNPNLYIIVEETDNSTGARTTTAGVNIQTHKVRRAKAVYRASPPTGGVLYDIMQPLQERLGDIVQAALLARRIRYTGGQLTALNSWNIVPLRFTRTAEGLVLIRGTISGTSATNSHVMTLPAELRPLDSVAYGYAMVRGASTTEKVNLEIHNNGDVFTSVGGEYFINFPYIGV